MKISSAKRTLAKCQQALGKLTATQVNNFLQKNLNDIFVSNEKLKTDQFTWNDLKRSSFFFNYYLSPRAYENLLTKYDSKLNFDFLKRNCVFLEVLPGKNQTLNSYRKVKIKGAHGCFFEKVYLIDSLDFVKVKFFYQKIYSLLSNTTYIPSVRFVYGNKVVIAYYDWIDGYEPSSDKQLLSFYSCFQQNLNGVYLEKELIDSVLYDFTLEPMYLDGVKKTLLNLKDSSSLLRCIEKELLSYKLVESQFAHGDFISRNISSNLDLIDFDKCGFYPKGYDLAYFMSKSFCFDSVEQLIDFASQYESLEGKKIVAFLFFYLIFYSRGIVFKPKKIFLQSIYLRLQLEYECE